MKNDVLSKHGGLGFPSIRGCARPKAQAPLIPPTAGRRLIPEYGDSGNSACSRCIKVLAFFLLSFSIAFYMLLNNPTKAGFKNITQNTALADIESREGVSWSDFDGDGDVDLIIQSRKLRLLENQGNSSFKDVTEEKFPENVCCPTAAAVFGDYNNDGYPDLFVTSSTRGDAENNPGKHLLYMNDRGVRFIDVTKKSGISCDGHAQGASWVDYDNDGYLDLFVVNFGINFPSSRDFINEKSCLFKNNGDGTFSEVSESVGIPDVPSVNLVDRYGTNPPITKKSLPFQPVWFDYNNDNLLDLFIAVDSGASPLYKNNGDGTFTDVTEETGLNKYGTGMGIAIGDYNNDMFLDIYVTNEGANYFWKNNGNGTFTETARELGVEDPFGFGWGTIFLDFDNDSDLDLFVANGINKDYVIDVPEEVANKNTFFENTSNGSFRDITEKSGLNDSSQERGAAVADFDNNGFLDLIIAPSLDATDKRVKLYRNNSKKNNWLFVKLKGIKSNRDAIGAKVWVTAGGKTQYQQVIAGSSYASQNSIWPHFGLGKAKKVDKIEILWPSGIRQVLRDVKANQIIEVTEEEN